MTYVLLIIGFVCLVKGADFFVSGSSSIARYFNIPEFVIGLTIVAFGTSLPEAAVSVTAALRGANGIALGNVLGSNLFNLLVVLGASALFKSCPVAKKTLRFEYPLSIVAAALVLGLCIWNENTGLLLSRTDGIILLAVFVFFLAMTVKGVVGAPNGSSELGGAEGEALSLPEGIVFTVIGVTGIIFGGNMVVDSAVKIAESFGIDETLIGLTIVAVGTSLPELVTSIVAATKGKTDIAVGNVIGSNLFNLLFVLGISVTIHPIQATMLSVYDSVILIGISLLIYIPFLTKKALDRKWGILLVLLYGGYMAYIIMRAM